MLGCMISVPVFAEECDTTILSCDMGVDGVLRLVIEISSALIGIVGLIGISIVGIQYMTARGNEQQVTKAKRRLLEVVIGFVIYALLVPITLFLMGGEKKDDSSKQTENVVVESKSTEPTKKQTMEKSESEDTAKDKATKDVESTKEKSKNQSEKPAKDTATEDVKSTKEKLKNQPEKPAKEQTTESSSVKQEPVAPENFKVTFITDNKNSTFTNVRSGGVIGRPVDPTRAGYTFAGWYMDDRREYNFNTPVTSDLTLHALWAPMVKYTNDTDGKWIFINNPEMLRSRTFLAESNSCDPNTLMGVEKEECNVKGSLLMKTTIDKTTEIHWAHNVSLEKLGGSDYFYYGIRIWNPNKAAQSVRVETCGAQTGGNGNGAQTAREYYTGGCRIVGPNGENLLGRSFLIPSETSVTIFVTKKAGNSNVSYVVSNTAGEKERFYGSGEIDGTIKITPSSKMNVSTILFLNDYVKTFNAGYGGNFLQKDGPRVFTGYIEHLPEVYNQMSYYLYDYTPTGELPVSFKDNRGIVSKNQKEWSTNNTGAIGGGVTVNSDRTCSINKFGDNMGVFVQDYTRLKIWSGRSEIAVGPYPESTDSRNTYEWFNNYYGDICNGNVYGYPWNWVSWNVHYNEGILIVNESKQTKKVTLKMSSESNFNTMCAGKFESYNGGGTAECSVTVQPGSKIKIPAIVTLGGNTGGTIKKQLILEK